MKLIISSILLGFGGFDPMGAILIIWLHWQREQRKNKYIYLL